MRRAAKVDKTQGEIVEAFRCLGFSVLLLHRVGGGCPDLLVGKGGKDLLVEVKTGNGKLRAGQKEFFETWRGATPRVVRSVDDVINLVKLGLF